MQPGSDWSSAHEHRRWTARDSPYERQRAVAQAPSPSHHARQGCKCCFVVAHDLGGARVQRSSHSESIIGQRGACRCREAEDTSRTPPCERHLAIILKLLPPSQRGDFSSGHTEGFSVSSSQSRRASCLFWQPPHQAGPAMLVDPKMFLFWERRYFYYLRTQLKLLGSFP